MVSVVLDCLGAGMSEVEILADYPTLTIDGIRAAAAYGADLVQDESPGALSQGARKVLDAYGLAGAAVPPR